MPNWTETAHNSCRKRKLRSKCLPCKAPQWAIVNWCQITYIILPGSEDLLPKTPQGKNKLEEAVMQSSPTELSLELSFVGRRAQVSLRGTACGGLKPHRSLEIFRDDGHGWVRCMQLWDKTCPLITAPVSTELCYIFQILSMHRLRSALCQVLHYSRRLGNLTTGKQVNYTLISA